MPAIEFMFTVPFEPMGGKTKFSHHMINNPTSIDDAPLLSGEMIGKLFHTSYEDQNKTISVSFSKNNMSSTNGVDTTLSEGCYLKSVQVSVKYEQLDELIRTQIAECEADTLDEADACNRIAIDAAILALKAANRLVKYFRTQKRQFLIGYLQTDENAARYFINKTSCTEFRCEGSKATPWKQIGTNKSFRSSRVITVLGTTGSSTLELKDLPEISSFIAKDKRGNASNEFLVNSRRLWHLEHYRSSTLEAYGAVEVAFNTFRDSLGKEPNRLQILHPHLDMKSVKNDLKNFGLTKSIRYLLPTLFLDLKNSNLIEEILELGENRQNISHVGSRKINSKRLQILIASAETFCDFLNSQRMETEATSV